MWSFIRIWTYSERVCSGSGFNSENSGLSSLLYLVVGTPSAFALEGLTLWLVGSRRRSVRLVVVLVALTAFVGLGLALQIGEATGPACPSGVPGWWPHWLPFRHIH